MAAPDDAEALERIRRLREVTARLPGAMADDRALAEAALAVGDPAAAVGLYLPWLAVLAAVDELVAEATRPAPPASP